MKKLVISKKEFLTWRFQQEEEQSDFAKDIILSLEAEQKRTITLNDVFEDTCFIPERLIKNKELFKDEIKGEELSEPSAFKVEWV